MGWNCNSVLAKTAKNGHHTKGRPKIGYRTEILMGAQEAKPPELKGIRHLGGQ